MRCPNLTSPAKTADSALRILINLRQEDGLLSIINLSSRPLRYARRWKILLSIIIPAQNDQNNVLLDLERLIDDISTTTQLHYAMGLQNSELVLPTNSVIHMRNFPCVKFVIEPLSLILGEGGKLYQSSQHHESNLCATNLTNPLPPRMCCSKEKFLVVKSQKMQKLSVLDGSIIQHQN